MKRQKNDDTLTKLGDIFHYLIVLEHCIEMIEGERIVVEMHGDISKFSANNSSNIEVKHHNNNHNLGDRNIDFWKSLNNWMENSGNLTEFKQFILLTTSKVKKESAFFGWNDLSKEEKYKRVKGIGAIPKQDESVFRVIYNKIFKYNKEDISNCLEKVLLYTSELRIEEKFNNIKKDRFFLGIEKEKISIFINELMGYILTKPISSPHTWYIEQKDFKKYVVEVVKRYSTELRPLPDIYADIEPNNILNYYKERFTNEIYKIEYGEEEIREAIVNYWRTKQTAINYFHTNPVYLRDFKLYKEELETKLKRMKRITKRSFDITDERKCITNSQDFYDKSLDLDAIPFGSVNPNRSFFQEGTIHEIVNEDKLNWLIKEEEL